MTKSVETNGDMGSIGLNHGGFSHPSWWPHIPKTHGIHGIHGYHIWHFLISLLVGGFSPPLWTKKKVSWFTIYGKQMFQTTNQIGYHIPTFSPDRSQGWQARSKGPSHVEVDTSVDTRRTRRHRGYLLRWRQHRKDDHLHCFNGISML
jgi:hypothetical protein